MKITKQYLKELIKEEVVSMTAEQEESGEEKTQIPSEPKTYSDYGWRGDKIRDSGHIMLINGGLRDIDEHLKILINKLSNMELEHAKIYLEKYKKPLYDFIHYTKERLKEIK